MRVLVIALATLLMACPVFSQDANLQGTAQSMRQALLAQGGLNADWSCARGMGGAETGRSQVTFKEEGTKVVVDVNNFARGTCKSEVAFSDTGATWKGCRGTPVQMVYDGNSKEVPFRGTGGQCTYQFKPR